jgi:type II secretory pathway predicted ATPase ExeA
MYQQMPSNLPCIHRVQPIVVVDEAHLLDREVRFLLNFRMDAQSPMVLILVGQRELLDRVKLHYNPMQRDVKELIFV